MLGFNKTDRPPVIDRPLALAIAALMVIGVAFVCSATTSHESARAVPWYNQLYLRQILWCVIGLVGAAAVCLVDYHRLARWSLVVYGVTILFLLAVLIKGIGVERLGARRWIDLGVFQFQPSEFAKLAVILALAHFLSRPEEELRQPLIFIQGVGMIGLPFLLILPEPDLGSALIVLPIGLVMLYVAGIPVRYIAQLISGCAILIALIMVDILLAPPGWQIKLEDYQRRRLLVYFGLDGVTKSATPAQRADARREMRNYSYNVEQALISVGSGGLFGKGWRQGTQSSLGYLPRTVAHNDFIFSVIAEEKGFLGSMTVLMCYAVVLFTGIRIAGQTRDRLGKLMAVGVIALWFSHVFINIGMNIRIMPVTGVPLPLLSYGGSSVLSSLIAAGILQNVYMYRRSY
jgi:rod shape determining protein RodA